MNNLIISGNTINTSGLLDSVSFTMPRDGIITSIGATFSTTLPISISNAALTLRTSLYAAAANSNLFTELPGTSVDLAPTLSGVIPTDQVFSQINSSLSVPVNAGTRLMLVFRLIITSGDLVSTVILSGTSSAGIRIS